jgi:23S rRNA pseudouridine2605 synthase
MPPTPEPERLQKVIARSGMSSRRVAEEWIADGRVSVDGEIAHLGQKVDPSTNEVMIDGVPLPTHPDLVYYLLNKPLGVISTAEDTRGRRTVVDLVPNDARVVPVGRLDGDSTGLLLLTNDGTLTNLITHPRHGVSKTYHAMVEGRLRQGELKQLTDGVELEDGTARARTARVIDTSGDQTHLEIVMGEGRKRIVRRMCEAIGHRVERLHRSGIGPLRDPGLGDGSHRSLTIEEVRALYAAAGSELNDEVGP